jgi:hypothetical protein
MSLFAIAVAVGLVGGYARGGRVGRLGQLQLRAPVFAGLALAFQAGAGLAPRSARFPLVAFSYALVGIWLVLNAGRRRPVLRTGVALLALGWLMNGLAIGSHRGMPVSADAMERAGFPSGYDVADGHRFKHVVDTRRTPADWLGDVIPVRPLGAVISLGDLALLAGVALCLGGAMVSSPAVLGPGSDVGGAPRHRGPHRAWREPAPPGDDGGATSFDPYPALAACGISVRLRAP